MLEDFVSKIPEIWSSKEYWSSLMRDMSKYSSLLADAMIPITFGIYTWANNKLKNSNNYEWMILRNSVIRELPRKDFATYYETFKTLLVRPLTGPLVLWTMFKASSLLTGYIANFLEESIK